MLALSVKFPARRYHATPWSRHVNEGDVEWPPSPWRILRALLAAGFAVEHWREDGLPVVARSLIDRLAGAAPSFRLPVAVQSHTRHYMPIRSGRGETTTLVLDPFLRFVDDEPELVVHWPVELGAAEIELLDRLLPAIAYLGRAESWAEFARIEPRPLDGIWCEPLPSEQVPRGDVVASLCPVEAEEYLRQREVGLERCLEAAAVESSGKLSAARRRRIESQWPADLMGALLQRTSELRAHGWTRPPASKAVRYDRPTAALRPASARRPMSRRSAGVVDTVLWALASDTVRGQLRPRMERALPQAELLHRSAVARLSDGESCPAITGRDADGRPLLGNRHVHYFPLDLDGDGRLDHVLAHAPMGLDPRAVEALLGVSRTWAKGLGHDLIVTCAGRGALEEITSSLQRGGALLPPMLGESGVWVSVTPFVLPRHPKRHRHRLEEQVCAELVARGLPAPSGIEVFQREELLAARLHRFVRRRRPGRPQPAVDHALGLRLRFPEPVRGPIAIGYASHFGLGLFVAE